MAETKEETRKDEFGNEFDMSAYIPEGDGEGVEQDMSAKTELGDGLHKTARGFGIVVSDEATDAAGLTPEKLAENTWGAGSNEAREKAEKKSSKKAKKDE